jgi:glyoxylase-like metal-dependent hydrolase (beta-lactamase superfamily II)
MILDRSMNPDWLSNTYLIGDVEGGEGAFVDAGGPVAPLLELADRHGLSVTHVLLTHHHGDHVHELGQLVERYPDAAVLAHPDERVPGVNETIQPGERVQVGELEVEAIPTPGHTKGMLSFRVGNAVFTGDTLFKGSVGGVRAPGHTTYADLRSSIMDRLMQLPPDTDLLPGHTDATTVGREWEDNAFIRLWRGLDPEGTEPCLALGEPATLILLAPDYDGGKKAWVRWPDGRDDIVPGSQVQPRS